MTRSSRFLTLVAFLLLAPASIWAQRQSHTVVIKATRHVLAPPLSKRVPILSPAERLRSGPEEERLSAVTGFDGEHEMRLDGVEEEDDRVLERGIQEWHAIISAPDAVQQDSVSATSLSTTAGMNFIGVGAPGSTNACPNGFPSPDTNGAVGPTQFVQWVNFCYAVFNKTTGALQYGPVASNTFWQPLGSGPCYSHDNFDPVAQYDKLAGRWVMLMPVSAEPTYLCVAVSTTSDAVNSSWNLYEFPIPAREIPDYPKLGVWPDAYYVTYNQFANNSFVGAAACALDRTDMLAGNAAAAMQCFTNIGASYGALLPGDLDGTTPPPTGSPDYFLNFHNDYTSLDLWQFHVNWTTPSQSTFTGPTNILVAEFSGPCGDVTIQNLQSGGGACIPQTGTTQMLNSYGDRVMFRLAYRNLGAHQSILVNHAISTGSSVSGVRWYELRNTGSGFSLDQQGTYAPDSNSRWMGSMAMDKAGDIALGYSVSGSSMSPTIRYTGQVPTVDPLGQMEGEVDILSSQGITPASQSGYPNWGDYSSMAIDPTDDCTFWYTTEYVPAAGKHWTTRIASFSFPNCTGAHPAWTIANKASGGGPHATNLTVPSTGTGNLIAVALMFNGATSVSSISDNAGNTYVSAGARTDLSPWSVEIWYAVTSKPGATLITPTFAGSPTDVLMSEWEVSGLATSGPDAVNTSTGTVLSNTPGAAVTTTGTGDFVVSVIFAGATSFSGISSGNDFTDDFTVGGDGWAHITSNTSSPGSQQASWSTSNAVGKYLSSTVAFFAAP